MFSKTNLASDAKKVFLDFAEKYCPEKLDLKIPNGAKSATCFHSGYFLL